MISSVKQASCIAQWWGNNDCSGKAVINHVRVSMTFYVKPVEPLISNLAFRLM